MCSGWLAMPGLWPPWCRGHCERCCKSCSPAHWAQPARLDAICAGGVTVLLYLGPLYTAVAAWGVLGEPLGRHYAAGAALIFSEVYPVCKPKW